MTDRTPQSSSDDSFDWEALARHLAGESGPEESLAIERWLDDEPDRARLIAALDQALEPSLVAGPADVDVEAALAVTRARMADPPVHAIDAARTARAERVAASRPAWRGLPARAAAIAAVLLGSALVFSLLDRDTGGVMEVARVHETATAVLDSLVLPDGTRVLIAPETRLTVLAGYGETSRELVLDGEAMFEVMHDDDRPFLVHVAGGVIQDLGTAFSVRTSTAGGASVVVTDGSVRLRRAGDDTTAGVVLDQGDRGLLSANGETLAERGAATDEDVAWTRGVLVFRDTPLAEVSAELHRWYGFDIQLAGTDLAERRLTATFRGESAAQVANIIALALGGRAEASGDTIVIHPIERP